MDAILDLLNAWRESNGYSAWLPYLRFAAMFVVGFVVGVGVAFTEADVLSDIRAALRHAGINDKAVQAYFQVNYGNCSDRLRGERPLTVAKLASLPTEFWQWFAVATAGRHGVPMLVTTGARLQRRQARMSLSSQSRERVS